MATTKVIDLGDFNVASNDRLRFTIKKNGVAWSTLTAVTIIFLAPDDVTTFSRSMIVENASEGIWYYDTTITDVLTPGYWKLAFEVTDGTLVKRYPYEIGMNVADQPY